MVVEHPWFQTPCVLQCDLLLTTERVAALINDEAVEAAPQIEEHIQAYYELQVFMHLLALLNEQVSLSKKSLQDGQAAHWQLVCFFTRASVLVSVSASATSETSALILRVLTCVIINTSNNVVMLTSSLAPGEDKTLSYFTRFRD